MSDDEKAKEAVARLVSRELILVTAVSITTRLSADRSGVLLEVQTADKRTIEISFRGAFVHTLADQIQSLAEHIPKAQTHTPSNKQH